MALALLCQVVRLLVEVALFSQPQQLLVGAAVEVGKVLAAYLGALEVGVPQRIRYLLVLAGQEHLGRDSLELTEQKTALREVTVLAAAAAEQVLLEAHKMAATGVAHIAHGDLQQVLVKT